MVKRKSTAPPRLVVPRSYPPPPSGGGGAHSDVAGREARRPRIEVALLLVGLDEATRSAVLASVGDEGGFRAESVSDLSAARHAIEANPRPTLVVIEAAALAKRLSFPPFVYVAAIAGPERDDADGFGADEVLRRPLHPDDLRLRLDRASRTLQKNYDPPPEDFLRAVLSERRGGEIIVRLGHDIARIHVEPGKVAWVHRASRAAKLGEILRSVASALTEDTVRDIVHESRAARRHFADIVVEWKIADHEVVRECLRVHLAAELCAIFEWQSATCTFIEDRRVSSGNFAFGADEVLPPAKTYRVRTLHEMRAVDAPAVDPALVEAWLAKTSEVPHVLGCTLVDPKLGTVLGSRGTLREDVALGWQMVALLSALGPTAEDALCTTPTLAYLARSVKPAIHAMAVVAFDPRLMSPALARILVGKAFVKG